MKSGRKQFSLEERDNGCDEIETWSFFILVIEDCSIEALNAGSRRTGECTLEVRVENESLFFLK